MKKNYRFYFEYFDYNNYDGKIISQEFNREAADDFDAIHFVSEWIKNMRPELKLETCFVWELDVYGNILHQIIDCSE